MNRRRNWTRNFLAIVTALALIPVCLNADEPSSKESTNGALRPSRFDTGKKIAELENEKITESSGIAASTLAKNRFWTHNDSGDKARLFAFDSKGRHLGTAKIDDASSKDWEDMASCQIKGRSFLVVGDVGDNGRRRKSYKLFIVDEPENPKKETSPAGTIEFTFEGGPQNCEAIAVDETQRLILLASKSLLSSSIYYIPWPKRSARNVVAKKLTDIPIPVVTGMDISADGRNIVFTSYVAGYEINKDPNEPWEEALRRTPYLITVPARMQGESVCYSRDGKSLYFTSERAPSPLIELQAQDQPLTTK